MDFIFANLNTIALVVWFAFFVLVVARVARPALVKNISYGWLVVIAIKLHLLYGAVATWGQYVAWNKSEFTRLFLSPKLSPEVPFPSLLEWTRPLFSGTHGYFMLYSFQHFFLNTLILFSVTGLFALFFKIYSQHRPASLKEGDIAVIALSFLIAGWPWVIVLVPLGFIFAISLAVLALLNPDVSKQFDLTPTFLFSVPVTFILGPTILNFLNLYKLLNL